MKTHRRVEITAFKRRVTIVSGEYAAFVDENDETIQPTEQSSLERIAPESDEGRRWLTEAVSLLQERLAASEVK